VGVALTLLIGFACLIFPASAGKALSALMVALHQPRWGDVPDEEATVRPLIVRLVGVVMISLATAAYLHTG